VDWAWGYSVPYQRIGTIVSIDGPQVRAGTIVNQKGSWHTLGVTNFLVDQFDISLSDYNDTFANMLLDIGLGPTGNEQVAIANMTYGMPGVALARRWTVPIRIPSGTRVSARAQNDTAGTVSARITMQARGANGQNPTSSQSSVHYGTSTTLSRGTLVDPGGTANVKGAWTEITPGTSTSHSSVTIVVQGNNASPKSIGNALIDVGIGPLGNETVVIPNLPSTIGASADHLPIVFGPFLLSLPPGTRIVARAQSTETGSTRQVYINILGHK
jgi:hypothetical protein